MSNESKPDLTAAEARAEVEAFLGEGWRCIATQAITRTAQPCHRFRVCAVRYGITNQATGPTYRAAVDALFQAWRDAVRPWCNAVAQDAVTAHTNKLPDANKCREAVSRVLGEEA